MRLVLGSLVATALAAAGLVSLGAAPARAQMAGMTCFNNVGGRATCMESSNSLYDRLNDGAAERRADEAARQRRLARKIAQAVHDGRCTEALELAVKATDPTIAANTARLCGVPEAAATPATPKS